MPRATYKTSMDELRAAESRVVNIALAGSALFALPALIASLSRVFQFGWHYEMGIDIALYSITLLTLVLRRRIPFTARVAVFLVITTILAVMSLLTWGLPGNGSMIFIITCGFTVLLLGVRSSLILTGSIVVFIGIVALSAMQGWITWEYNLHTYETSGATWATHILSFGCLALLIIGAVGWIRAALIRTIDSLHERGLSLEEAKARLEEEVKERAHAEEEVRKLNAELEDRIRQRTSEIRVLSQAIEQSPVSVMITDKKGVIEYVNPAFSKISGYGLEEMTGREFLEIFSEKTPPDIYEDMRSTVRQGRIWEGELTSFKKSGEEYIEEICVGPLLDDYGDIMKYVGVKLDITHRKHLENTLLELSRTDPLTGLANRRVFDETLSTEIRRAGRSGMPLSLIMLDIDFFKLFNDTYGHQAGDNCIQQVAGVLKASARRAGDQTARYGGEEFVVILPNTMPEKAMQLAEDIRINISSLAIPHEKSAVSSFVSVSLGVAALQNGEPMTPEQLIMKADESLYRAKANGRNRVEAG